MIVFVLVFLLDRDEILAFVDRKRRDIKNMVIRGATTIAIEMMKTIKFVAENASDEDFDDLIQESIKLLRDSRPTEPAAFNGLDYVSNKYKLEKIEDPSVDRKLVISSTEKYLDMLYSAFDKIIEIGSKLIHDDFIVITHCRSSTVTSILKKAHEEGKDIKVISTETRPAYQGRSTSRELADLGIKVYHIVDSAMHWAIDKYKPDLAIIGADAITSVGSVINKIGSNLLALVAREHHIPLYVASTLLKLDTRTLYGEKTEIEMRIGSEVWGDAPDNVEILNPAFEMVDPEFITGFISEAGILPPNLVSYVFKELYPDILILDRAL